MVPLLFHIALIICNQRYNSRSFRFFRCGHCVFLGSVLVRIDNSTTPSTLYWIRDPLNSNKVFSAPVDTDLSGAASFTIPGVNSFLGSGEILFDQDRL